MSAQHKSSRIDEWLLQKAYRAAGQPAVRLALRNGAEVSPKGALPVPNIVIQDRKTLFRLLLDPEAEFGDAYSKGRITLDGDLVSALEIVYRSMSEVAHNSWYVKLSRSAWNIFSATPCAARVEIFGNTTILIPIFTSSGSTRNSSIPALIMRLPVQRWSRRKSRNWTTFAARCNSSPGSASWKRAAAGALWPCTWPKTME